MAFLTLSLPGVAQNAPGFQTSASPSCKIYAEFIIHLYTNKKFKRNVDFQVSILSSFSVAKQKWLFPCSLEALSPSLFLGSGHPPTSTALYGFACVSELSCRRKGPLGPGGWPPALVCLIASRNKYTSYSIYSWVIHMCACVC